MTVAAIETTFASLQNAPATQVRRAWSAVRESLRVHKTLALTAHDRIEAVLLDPAEYAALVARAAEADQALLRTLTERFDARLAALNQADARARLHDAFAANGQFVDAPVAGQSF
jgi:PHD/YefM family antitoxin component YafN of YafNO toxin-antitoxin module